jgi:histidinol dehydrogenase
MPAQVVLAAAAVAGVDRMFAIGGAGAIAAMAFGTESVPRVDRIVGPGNAYVAEAKLQVSGSVAIDNPAGPSELLIIADDGANAEGLAREILAQAEHDPRAVVAVTCSNELLADAVEREVRAQLASQPRRQIIETALQNQGALLWFENTADAVTFANAFAPEHLLLATRDREQLCALIRTAGTIFVGESSSVAFGDYITGANHVLPTGGLARSYSGLSTLDFVRWTTYQVVDPSAARSLSEDVVTMATAENLPAHARAAAAWGASA